MQTFINLAKTLGGGLLGILGTWLLSTDGVTAIQSMLPHTPVMVIFGGLVGMIIHGFGTSVQSLAAQLAPPADPPTAAQIAAGNGK